MMMVKAYVAPVTAYCPTCKLHREIKVEVTLSESGRRTARGPCPVCGTELNKVLPPA